MIIRDGTAILYDRAAYVLAPSKGYQYGPLSHSNDRICPETAKPSLGASLKNNGLILGLHSTMAEAPGLLAAYNFAHQQFMATSLTDEEKTVIWRTVNVDNACHYCVPAHTGIAKIMKVDDAITDALRDKTPLPTAKLEALRTFTLQVVRTNANLTDAQTQVFLDACFEERNILEVILGVAHKVMSNFTNHFAKTPVDQVLRKYSWEKTAPAAQIKRRSRKRRHDRHSPAMKGDIAHDRFVAYRHRV